MVTYSQLNQVDLGSLASAAGDFESLVRKWDLTQRMQNEVIGTIQQSGWHGDAAGLANAKLTWARDQIHAAFEEASALAKTLRDAHTEITAAKNDLTTAVRNATDAGLTVDGEGAVHWPPPTNQADKKDAEYAKSWKAKAETAAKAIGDAIDRATEADLDASRALGDDTGSDGTAFNANPVGGIPEEEAKAATYILSLGDQASDAQLKHLQDILDHHKNDPRFATSFYGNQDPATFMAKYGAMAQSGDYANSSARTAAIKGIQQDLGLTLATATDTKQPLHVSDEWEKRFRAAGATQIPLRPGADPAKSPYGYQIMANLLRNGSYDAHFLNPVAQHITQLTQENPTRWEVPAYRSGGYPFDEFKFIGQPDKDGNLKGFNPLSGILDAFGHSPEAATKFFNDPVTTYNPDGSVKSTGGQNTYFKLFTDSGNNSVLVDMNYPLRPLEGGPADPSNVGPLGHALEAAATGRAWDDTQGKYPPHTPEMSAVMQQVVQRFGNGDGPSLLHGGVFADLNGSVGNMTANYIADIENSLEGPGAKEPTPGVAPAPGVATEFAQKDVQRLLLAVGRDTDAYASIATAQQAYQTAQIQQVMAHPELHKDLGMSIENVTKPGGIVTGLITSAMSDEIFHNHAVSDQEVNDAIDAKKDIAKTVWDYTGGVAAEKIPKVGGLINDQVDEIMTNVANSYHVDTTNQAADDAGTKVATSVTGSQQAVVDAVKSAGRDAGLDPNYLSELARQGSASLDAGCNTGHRLFQQQQAAAAAAKE
ncbi:hypothetical protein ACFY4B_11840 [Kitasatospora sp. NPDC001261]|uniref:hypothetical protein n=1 Tax=Kitasatospora sp. NPDC001261 TaxID=3364012 RepID=UPI00367365D9